MKPIATLLVAVLLLAGCTTTTAPTRLPSVPAALPSATPSPAPSFTPTFTATFTATLTATLTVTPVPPTSTATPVPPTSTPTATPTLTLTPTASRTPYGFCAECDVQVYDRNKGEYEITYVFKGPEEAATGKVYYLVVPPGQISMVWLPHGTYSGECFAKGIQWSAPCRYRSKFEPGIYGCSGGWGVKCAPGEYPK